MKYLFITSCNKHGYQDYGRRFLETFKKHFPYECILVCFYEGWTPQIEAGNIWYFNLDDDKEHQAFKERHKNDPRANGLISTQKGPVSDYRWNAVRFSHKIAALTSPELPSSEWRIWIDADIVVEKDIPLSFFDGLLSDQSIVAQYIGRPANVFHTSECGWVAYNTKNADAKQFLSDFRKCYLADDVFSLPETHDSFVFDRIREHYEQHGCKFQDIAAGIDYPSGDFHPWPRTALGQYMTHLKGPVAKQEYNATANAKKEPISVKVHSVKAGAGRPKVKTPPKFSTGPDTRVDLMNIANGCRTRYTQIVNLIKHYKPKVILEVGTFNGSRAVEMCKTMIDQGQAVHYIGYDVFEDATPELNEKEFNGKKPTTYQEAIGRLTEYKNTTNGLFTFELFKGLTSDTLWNQNVGAVDFAFIDGGHSVETIRGDYEALKQAKVIVFDDFYLHGVDTTKFGCNEIVKNISHSLLPVIETVTKSGVQIALVLAGTEAKAKNPISSTNLPAPPQDNNIKIKTRNCVEDTVIHNNIRYSAKYAREAKKKELATVSFAPPILQPTDEQYMFVGGGESVLDRKHSQYHKNWEAIKIWYSLGKKIMAVKTSYDALMARDIIPWGCFLLDPRDHVADCIKQPHKNTVYFIASMCDKTTWDKFAGGGYKCVGYHAGVLVNEDKVVAELYDKYVMVQGGTTSGFRGISLFYTLGVRNFVLVGFDSSYENKPEKVHGRSPKPAIQVHVHGKDFWTDAELIAQSNDMEAITKALPNINIKYLGNGMLQHANQVLKDMMERQKGDKGLAGFQLNPYIASLQANNDLSEALTIYAAARFIGDRVVLVDDTLKRQDTLEQFLVKSV